MRAVLRSAALRVVVLAMVLRALVPDGWMPNAQAATGGAVLVPCPGAGPGASQGTGDLSTLHGASAHPAGLAAHDMPDMTGMAGMHHAMSAMAGLRHDMSAMPAGARHAMASLPGGHRDGPAAPSHDHAKTTLCIFAATAQLGSPAPDIAALPPAPLSVAAPFAVSREAPASLPAHRPNAARAPPAPA